WGPSMPRDSLGLGFKSSLATRPPRYQAPSWIKGPGLPWRLVYQGIKLHHGSRDQVAGNPRSRCGSISLVPRDQGGPATCQPWKRRNLDDPVYLGQSLPWNHEARVHDGPTFLSDQ